MYTITKAQLDTVPFFRAADIGGTLVRPLFVVMHYTGGPTQAGAQATLTRKDENYVSAHVLVGPDGRVTQLVPFDRQAWHAGQSSWNGYKSINHCSFGIELVNPGYVDVTKRAWPEGTLRAAHKNGGPIREWYKYPQAQLDAAAMVCASLFRYYGTLEEIVGHDDIAPGRKSDPGPAFNMVAFHALVKELRQRADTFWF